ncbi:MAG: Tn7 transposase TnsA N-terminal domain-containing protein [Clostridiales bacterium]|nr:Tn7 transposase TnsA N-terminal domain-containing protein [Clostridiales bacterium]
MSYVMTADFLVERIDRMEAIAIKQSNELDVYWD